MRRRSTRMSPALRAGRRAGRRPLRDRRPHRRVRFVRRRRHVPEAVAEAGTQLRRGRHRHGGWPEPPEEGTGSRANARLRISFPASSPRLPPRPSSSAGAVGLGEDVRVSGNGARRCGARRGWSGSASEWIQRVGLPSGHSVFPRTRSRPAGRVHANRASYAGGVMKWRDQTIACRGLGWGAFAVRMATVLQGQAQGRRQVRDCVRHQSSRFVQFADQRQAQSLEPKPSAIDSSRGTSACPGLSWSRRSGWGGKHPTQTTQTTGAYGGPERIRQLRRQWPFVHFARPSGSRLQRLCRSLAGCSPASG